MSKKCYYRLYVDNQNIIKMRYGLIQKFAKKALDAWAEKEGGIFYVYFKAPCSIVKKTILKKLTCNLDIQDISPCTIDEINQAINSVDAIYKQDNRKHKKNKKMSIPIVAPIVAPISTPIPAPTPASTPAHTSANICGNPIFFDLDKSDDSLSDND